jgi:hypothetical protein
MDRPALENREGGCASTRKSSQRAMTRVHQNFGELLATDLGGVTGQAVVLGRPNNGFPLFYYFFFIFSVVCFLFAASFLLFVFLKKFKIYRN